MTDKFRKTNPLVISFLEGEGPTANKLNQLATQVRSGTGLLEKAVGDTWNQSGDTVLTDTPIQIPNLARVIGELKYLNPVIYPVKEAFNFRDQIGAKYLGKSEGYLTFPAVSGVVTEVNSMATFTTEVTDEYLVDSATEYWFDSNTGKFKVGAPLTAEIVEYTVDTSQAFQHYDQVLPSLIPDPRQDAFTSLRIEKSGSDYYMHLSPRRPLTLAGTDFTFSGIIPERYPHPLDTGVAAAAETNEAAVILGGGAGQAGHSNRLYWQDTNDALEDAHYRYQFPKEIQDWLDTSPTAGTQMPEGYMYLWNTSTDTMIEDVKFYVADGAHAGKDWVAKVTSTAFDFNTVQSANYDSGLVLICPGASITRSIWHLFTTLYSHNHSKYLNSDGAISHQSLKNVNPPTNVATQDHFGRYPTYLGVWPMSAWTSDEHNSLLSRAGSQTDSARVRDKWNNAILGHVIIANADTSGAESYLDADLTDDSFKLTFGDINGPYIQALNGPQFTVSGETHFNVNQVDRAVITASGLYITGSGANPSLQITPGTGLAAYFGGRVTIVGDTTDDALIVTAAGANKDGITTTGSTSGAGIRATGGTSGKGVIGSAGTGSDENGVYGQGDGTGAGVYGAGSTGGSYGIYGRGTGVGGGGIGVHGYGTSTNHGVWGYASNSGAGVHAESVNGYGLIAESDTSSPISAALRIVPQDDFPTTSGAGDIFIHDPNSSVGKIVHFNGHIWERSVPQTFSLTDASVFISETDVVRTFYTIPINQLIPGSTIRIKAWGTISGVGAGNVLIEIELGSTTVAQTIDTAPSNGWVWRLEGEAAVYTEGNPGTGNVSGVGYLGSAAGAVTPRPYAAAWGPDTTSTIACNIRATFGNNLDVQIDGFILDIT